jgi:hypothetical protein
VYTREGEYAAEPRDKPSFCPHIELIPDACSGRRRLQAPFTPAVDETAVVQRPHAARLFNGVNPATEGPAAERA